MGAASLIPQLAYFIADKHYNSIITPTMLKELYCISDYTANMIINLLNKANALENIARGHYKVVKVPSVKELIKKWNERRLK